MMILLSRKEYDDLVKKSTATELIADEMFQKMKIDFKEKLQNILKEQDFRRDDPRIIFQKIRDLLQHY